MSVLVVEDEPAFQASLLDFMTLSSIDVVMAPNGRIALQFAEDPALTFRVVIADLHLGGAIDGAQVAEAVLRRTPTAKIVIMSGRYDLFDLNWMQRGWILLPKPFKLPALARHLV